jgi:hypothetical protein
MPPSVGPVFPVLGGVPFRPGPFFAIFGPFLPKNEQNGALAYIGEAPFFCFGGVGLGCYLGLGFP